MLIVERSSAAFTKTERNKRAERLLLALALRHDFPNSPEESLLKVRNVN